MESSLMHMHPSSTAEKVGFETVRSAISFHITTRRGEELLENLQPSGTIDGVTRLRSETAEMLSILEAGQSLPLVRLEDIDHWLDQAKPSGSVLPSEAFNDIRNQIRTGRILRSFMEKSREVHPHLWQIVSGIETPDNLETSIQKAISDQGEVKDDASPALKKIRGSLNSKKENLRKTIQRLYKQAADDGLTSDEGTTLRSGRMVIPVRSEHKRKLDGFVHDLSASGQTVYIEPAQALQINNDIRQLEVEERREINRILMSLTDQVRLHRETLITSSSLLGEIDLIHARCRAAKRWDGVMPELSHDGNLRIVRAFNPSLLLKNLAVKQARRDSIIPLELEMTDSELSIIISGPNAGGKSVALKTTGILICMHQCGIPLPLNPNSQLPVFSGVFLDMGDEQSIENDLSTFSSRLSWMRNTLEKVDKDGLVLIDEAGTGTDPDAGSALFQAFMEMVISRKARLIATTHHSAMKQFAHDHPHIVNGAMEFDSETLAPTYRFRKGIPGSSYAFEIAGRLRLPETLLERARLLIGEQKDRMADLLLTLETELNQARESRQKFNREIIEAEKQKRIWQEKSGKFDREKSEILSRAYEEADTVLKEANRKIEQAVEMIVEQGRQDGEKVKQARKLVEDQKQVVRDQKKKRNDTGKKTATDQPPEIGDHVRLADSDNRGELIEREGNRAVVLAGGLKIKTAYNNLVKSSPPSKTSSADKVASWRGRDRVTKIDRKTVGPTLDIRGQRGEEAVNSVMHYLDNAIAVGLKEVDIIHGTGEGILKKWVREYLEGRKDISGFEEAPLERGGAGCTIVNLS